jgi:hypothetical protein
MERLDESIHRVVEGIWARALGWSLRTHPDAPAGAGDVLEGRVDVVGAWEGTISLQCPAAFAREAAAILFGAAPEGMSEDQTRDALGELTNMTGGSLKALFPGPSRLVPPSVVSNPAVLPPPGSRLLRQMAFECRGHFLRVTVLEREPGGGR